MKTHKILSIDACVDCCGCDHTEKDAERCWTWNDWHTIGQCEKIPETVGEAFELIGFDKNISKLDLYYLEDDQYNIVITEKKTNRPVIAFEYGSQS